MGQAKQRGTKEERVAKAIEREENRLKEINQANENRKRREAMEELEGASKLEVALAKEEADPVIKELRKAGINAVAINTALAAIMTFN